MIQPQPDVGGGWAEEVTHFGLPSSWLLEGERRLDAKHYSEEAVKAAQILEGGAFATNPLGALTEEIFSAPISKRHYTDDGAPYLTPSQVFHFQPKAEKEVVKHKLRDPERWMVESGWMLAAQSGSLGRLRITSPRLEEFVISQNMLRIVPKEGMPYGFVYAFLLTWMGQALMTKDRYGAAVKHLNAEHLEGIPIPQLRRETQQRLHNKILEAYRKRDHANDLLDEAEAAFYSEAGLSEFTMEDVEYLGEDDQPRAFSVPAAALGGRFDASNHVPVVNSVLRKLEESQYDVVRLGERVDRVYVAPRFKRIYVDPEYGPPLLQGSHLPLMRYYDLKHISKEKTRNLDRWLVKEGWVLVTCSGTIGRTGLVTPRMEDWAVSQHILRIMPEEGVSHPGFLATYLDTPYGQHQLKGKIYGGVVDELTEEDTADVRMPDAPYSVQKAIGKKYVRAYKLRDEAVDLEDDAVDEIEKVLS